MFGFLFVVFGGLWFFSGNHRVFSHMQNKNFQYHEFKAHMYFQLSSDSGPFP